MKLSRWLDRGSVPQAGLARRLGVHRSIVNKWVRGHTIPSPEHMNAIAEVTGGEVTALDFYPPVRPRRPNRKSHQ